MAFTRIRVVAISDCGWDSGVFAGSHACAGGVAEVIPLDLHIPSCPPSPTRLLEGLLVLLKIQ
ncbi:MAG: hypothetical protein H6975_00790 [Gammaproteobacteria bacterium]|nr:hypothetical protein [Gammaproteobacteria bacterium]